jgi:hypothetical protein
MQWITEGIFVAAVAVIYLAPAFIAERRGHRNAIAIYILTLLLGWTFIGWAIALVWACTANITPIVDDTEVEPLSEPEDDRFKFVPPVPRHSSLRGPSIQ